MENQDVIARSKKGGLPVMRWQEVHWLIRVTIGAVVGVLIAIGTGFLAVRLLQGQGFDDLAAAAVTVIFGIPAGALVGGFVGWWLGRDRQDDGKGSSNDTMTSV